MNFLLAWLNNFSHQYLALNLACVVLAIVAAHFYRGKGSPGMYE